MNGEPGAQEAPDSAADEQAHGQDILGVRGLERDAMLAWVGENLTLVRRSASGQRPLYWILAISFAVGLACHVGGFLLKTSVTAEPLLLLADLLYALGWSLWTSVIVVMFVEVWPEAKRRQYKRALDIYETTVGSQARAANGHGPGPVSAEDA